MEVSGVSKQGRWGGNNICILQLPGVRGLLWSLVCLDATTRWCSHDTTSHAWQHHEYTASGLVRLAKNLNLLQPVALQAFLGHHPKASRTVVLSSWGKNNQKWSRHNSKMHSTWTSSTLAQEALRASSANKDGKHCPILDATSPFVGCWSKPLVWTHQGNNMVEHLPHKASLRSDKPNGIILVFPAGSKTASDFLMFFLERGMFCSGFYNVFVCSIFFRSLFLICFLPRVFVEIVKKPVFWNVKFGVLLISVVS